MKLNIERMRRYRTRGIPDEITFDLTREELDVKPSEIRERNRRFIEAMTRKHGYGSGQVDVAYEEMPSFNGFRFRAKFTPHPKECS